jgi:guanidinoacetate N-methyltransferase
MEDWQTPVMKAMARYACENHGEVLEIGFGRGVSAGFIQAEGVTSHTVIEPNRHSIEAHYQPWREKHAGKDIKLVEGRWQDVLDQLKTYDGIFFHAFPLNEKEFVEHILKSITYAEHALPALARLLKPGGICTYLTTEVDSLSRRHQRLLFKYFDEVSMHVVDVDVPADTKDAWWAPSMVVVKAVKKA